MSKTYRRNWVFKSRKPTKHGVAEAAIENSNYNPVYHLFPDSEPSEHRRRLVKKLKVHADGIGETLYKDAAVDGQVVGYRESLDKKGPKRRARRQIRRLIERDLSDTDTDLDNNQTEEGFEYV